MSKVNEIEQTINERKPEIGGLKKVNGNNFQISLRAIQIILWLACSAYLANAQIIKFEVNAENFTKSDIQKELEKYPKDLLHNYLNEVIVVDDSKMCGRAEVFSNRIVLSTSCKTIRQTIHHELSSLFLQLVDGQGKAVGNSPILNTIYGKFLKLNGNIKYTYSNNVYGNQPIDSSLADYFYISRYATRDFENDFNIIAQFLFAQGNTTISFMESHPEKPVSKKIKLVLEFYQNLSPDFTIDFFKKQSISK